MELAADSPDRINRVLRSTTTDVDDYADPDDFAEAVGVDPPPTRSMSTGTGSSEGSGSMSTTARRWGRGPRVWGARTFCALLGLVYLVIGIVGLIETGSAEFEGTTSVAGLGGTTLLNIIHTAAGALALGAALHSRTTRLFGYMGLVFFLGLSVYSVVALIGDTETEPLGISVPSTVLHFAAVVVCAVLIAFTVGVREPAVERESATST